MKDLRSILILLVVIYVAFVVTVKDTSPETPIAPIAHTSWRNVNGYTIELIHMEGDILSVSIDKADSVGSLGYNAERYNFTEENIEFPHIIIEMHKSSMLCIKKSAFGSPELRIFQSAEHFFDIY